MLKITQVKYTVKKEMRGQNRRAMKSSSRWGGNKLDIFQPTTNHPHDDYSREDRHGDNLECVSSCVSSPIGRVDWPRSVGSLSRTRVHAYARDGSAHTPARRGGAVTAICTPTRTAFIHKSGENGRARASRRTAPCFSPRPPAFYERNVRCLSSLDSVHNHRRAASAKEIVC